MDLSLERIDAARDRIHPPFLDSPQFIDERLSAEHGREVVVKVETLNPIGSFKGRGTWLVAQELDPERTWVCATAGNFGQGLAYAARARGAHVQRVRRRRCAAVQGGAHAGARRQADVSDRAAAAARAYIDGDPERRVLVKDGLAPAIAEGAGTIGAELESAGPLDAALVQIGDGALISGVARWLKSRVPGIRVIGVCASGAPAMARSFEAGRAMAVRGNGTIAAALSITDPVPESLERVSALVDEIVLVDDEDLRSGLELDRRDPRSARRARWGRGRRRALPLPPAARGPPRRRAAHRSRHPRLSESEGPPPPSAAASLDRDGAPTCS